MKLKHNYFIYKIIILIFIGALFINGCAQQQNTPPTEIPQPSSIISAYHPTNINTFASANEGEIIRFYFFLEDSNGDNTLGDGQASLQIKDSTGKVVLTKSFGFKSSEFVDYEFGLTGQEIGKAYEWRIDKNSIEKGIGTGTAELELTTSESKVIMATDTYIQIPIYTEEEIKQIYEESYIRAAKSGGETIKKGNFEITLIRYGFYTHLKYDTWGDEVTEFRVDLKVKNIGSEKDSFLSYGSVVIYGSNQYERSFNSKLDSSDIYPGIIKEGYLIFENVPNTLTGHFKIVTGTSYDASYDKLTYEFNVNI